MSEMQKSRSSSVSLGIFPAIWMGRNASVPVEHHKIQSWLEQCGLEESLVKVHFTDE